jgi:hypothetical protein
MIGAIGRGIMTAALVASAPLVAGAQATASAPAVAPAVSPGTFRGRFGSEAVTGAARWRHEIDSLDWRWKLTLRVTLDRPDHPRLVIRRSGLDVPAEAVLTMRDEGDRPDLGYYTLRVDDPRRGATPVPSYGGDSVILSPVRPVLPGSVIRARVHVTEYRAAPAGPRTLVGEVAATYDPPPAPSRVAMSDSLQEALLRRALADGGTRWLDAQVHVRANDSTHDAGLMRAFLTARYGNGIRLDDVRADNANVYLSAHGRHAPVACENDGGRVRCWSTRTWWSRLRGAH